MDTKAILKELTVDEKIRLLGGMGDWFIYDCNGKVPKVMMTDGPHGLRKIEVTKAGDVEASNPATCFPTASAMASSWDPEMTYLEGETLADEALMEKISIVLGCGMNIKRSPFCGRNFEYYSEDPLLAGKMAGGFISGTQSKGIGTCLKHFAVNSQETRRMTSDSIVDERALREIYLAGFEDCIKTAKPYTVMTSYNRVNGTYAAANKHLLTDILRDEWGFEGAVVSDWGASIDIVACIKAGLNLEMPDPKGYHTRVLKKAYMDGEISDELLDEKALKILDSFATLSERVEENHPVDFDAHNAVARKLSASGAVLLKNDGALPVSKEKKLIIIGDLAENVRFQGGGSSHINPARQKNALKAFESAGYKYCFAKGYDRNTENTDSKLVSQVKELLEKELDDNSVVLFFLGLTDAFEGEGYDRKDLSIPGNQTELLDEVAKIVNKDQLAAVTFGGAPFDFSFEDKVSSILHMYLGGQAVGEAVCDLVTGAVNPSGKLAETFPLKA
ncbi:MAG: glycoside hydrolase family 3 C-terminal domain-containing protein, partial [Lachnospiraceae bacterium]|nr:glycoside hydrolase family 3 C-terminal domain-containing protein [Lachnospiraceae bacterium]